MKQSLINKKVIIKESDKVAGYLHNQKGVAEEAKDNLYRVRLDTPVSANKNFTPLETIWMFPECLDVI